MEMGPVFLVVSELSSEKKNLFLINGRKELETHLTRIKDYRISPIFKVSSSSELPSKDHYQIKFYTFNKAYKTIGLISQLDPNLKKKLWFSQGLVSLAIFDPTDEELKLIDENDEISSNILANEVWEIGQNKITNVEYELSKPTEYKSELFRIKISDEQKDPDAYNTLIDIRHGINVLIPLAAQHCPTYLPLCKALVDQINEFSSFLDNYHQELAKTSVIDEPAIADTLQKKINNTTDQLVQINSVLAYAISQSFGGVIPLLNTPCYVHSYSLLGIGIAILALHSFIQSVDRAFAKAPIYDAVKNNFSSAKAFPVFKTFREIDLDIWRDQPDEIDRLIEVIKKLQSDPPKPRPHIMFFSGRLGFQESTSAISAATQSLYAADTIRWSLMTLSHETMHSHVRDLLGAIFSPYPGNGGTTAESFSSSYEKYKKFINEDIPPDNLLESIRFGIFNYCRFRKDTEKNPRNTGTSKTIDLSYLDLSEKDFYELLMTYYNYMNEVMVHTLDFRYFYDSNAELYIDYLWESWSTVPSVLADPEHYILRTIAAISIRFNGSLMNKFNHSLNLLKDRIDQLFLQLPHNVLLARVKEILNGPPTALMIPSLSNQYLAELSAHTLFASELNSILIDDPLVESKVEEEEEEEQLHYMMNTGEFNGVPIQSPVSLLVDRIHKLRKHEDCDFDSEYSSAWLFMVASSLSEELNDV